MTSKTSADAHGGLEMSSLSSKSESPVKVQDYREKEDTSAITLQNVSEHDMSKSLVDDSSDTATNSSDEFDWDAEDDPVDAQDLETKRKTRRGRKIYGLFMRLARPVRTALVATLGAGVFISLFFAASEVRVTWPHGKHDEEDIASAPLNLQSCETQSMR